MYTLNIGEKFNELTVIGEAKRVNGKRMVLCKCSCGKITVVDGYKLRKGNTKSCGCKKIKDLVKRSTKHGYRNTLLYSKWCGMKRRCNNINDTHYKNYGAKGIKVYNEWNENFECFKDWSIENNYNDSLSIERININGNYEPNNCKWITMEEQQSNKNNTIRVIYNGKLTALVNIAKELNINKKTLSSRYYRFIKRNPDIDRNKIEYNMLIPR